MKIRMQSGPCPWSRAAMVLLGVALAAGLAWAAAADEEPAAMTMEREMVIDPTTGMEVPAPQYGGTLTAANDRDIANTDQSVGGLSAGYANSGVVEKLGIGNWGIDRSINPMSTEYLDITHYTGALAQSWEQPDPTTFIFTVRENARWHDKEPMNGRPLTASDIVFNFQRLSGTGPFEEPPPNTSRMPQLNFTRLEAIDDGTVYIEIDTPPLDALKVLIDDNFGFILPPEVIKANGDVADWRTLVGTGPFMLMDWVEAESLTFHKNPDYWGHDEKYPDNQLPYVDEVKVLIMPESATYIAALRAGRIDYIGHNMSTHLSTIDEADSLLRTNPELRANSYYFRSNQVFAMYVQDEPFDDIRVRQAMQMALDNETIAATLYKGQALATPQGVVGRALKDYVVPYEEWSPELQHAYSYDPDAAEALLDAAGYPRGDDGVRFKVPLQQSSTGPLQDYPAIAVEYWKAIGVEVVVDAVDGAEFVSRLDNGQLFGAVAGHLRHALLPARLAAVAGAGGEVEPRPVRRPGLQRPGHAGARGNQLRRVEGTGEAGRSLPGAAALVHVGSDRSQLQLQPAVGRRLQRRLLHGRVAEEPGVRPPVDRPGPEGRNGLLVHRSRAAEQGLGRPF